MMLFKIKWIIGDTINCLLKVNSDDQVCTWWSLGNIPFALVLKNGETRNKIQKSNYNPARWLSESKYLLPNLRTQAISRNYMVSDNHRLLPVAL